MLTRSKLKLGGGELAEFNPEICRFYTRGKISEEIPFESDPHFMDSFLNMKAMVEEMYREFKKGRAEDPSNSKKDKGVGESIFHDHSKGKAKEEKLPTPPSSPENKRKTSLIKLDVKFDLLIYDGELNVENDLGGCWWPSTYRIWTPTTVSFSFLVS